MGHCGQGNTAAVVGRWSCGQASKRTRCWRRKYEVSNVVINFSLSARLEPNPKSEMMFPACVPAMVGGVCVCALHVRQAEGPSS